MAKPNRNEDADYLTVTMVMKRLNLCRSRTVQTAKKADALSRIGNVQRINWSKLKDYIDNELAE